TYSVTLTVTNDTCSNTFTRTVSVINEKAVFATNDTVICRNQSAAFVSSGITAANIAGWRWEFGDGTTANTASAVSHTYTTSGTYTVRLIITDLLGCRDTATTQVTVHGARADFSVSNAVSCLDNNRTTFTDLSTSDGIHPIVKWEWNYGDGTVDSSGTAPYQHSYATAGNYTVSLLVRDAFGCTDVASRPAAVVISQPVAGFFSPDTVNCTGGVVNFTNTSTGSGLQYAWTLGDGNTSTQQNPVHNYAAIGTYSIGLEVTDQYVCKDRLDRPAYVSISYPKASFSISDSMSTCPPLLVNFTNHSTDYTSLSWDFGDGTSSNLDSPSHFYTTAGIYYAILTVRGPGGCTDTALKRIEIKGPSGSFSYTPLTGCRPLTVNFTGTTQNNATYTWDFADGTIVVTTDSVISHTYTNAGEFVPRLILTDVSGCSVPIVGADTVRVTGVTAGFNIGASTFCNDGTVQFTNTTVSNDFIASYEWNFGDGTTSTQQHPSHHYTTPGTYTVSLLVTSQAGCRDSITLIDTVKIFANPSIAIAHDSSGCVPVTVGFSGQVISGNPARLQWNWNFGNGQTDTVQNPASQIYTNANAYTVTSMVTDENGCRDTASVVINAYPIPVVDAGANLAICRGSFAQLNATGADTYTWNAAPSLSCTTCPSPLAAPTDSTRYYVTGTTQFGCSALDSITIRVHQPFTLQVGKGDTVCAGTPVQLRATGADQYTWQPSAGVTNPDAGITTAIPYTTTTYRVVARDNYNCFVDTGSVHVLVWQYPTVDAGVDKTVSIGSTLTLQPKYSNDITRYQWNNPLQTLSCTDCPTPVVKTKGAQNTYRIQVTNGGGCVTTDEITIYAICNGANLFIPNTFSPNTDGKNDRFYPRGAGLTQIKSLRVYNRWGEAVFVASNFNANDAAAGWDGSYKGKVLPPDVYVYTCEVVCQNNEVLIYNGNVTLLR
ncbi:MAG TPA: PKD domain-containing protein, partial [Flavisolibacter sp.]|nr:PKD domain-containing protein [Flavisolibacter sp.]